MSAENLMQVTNAVSIECPYCRNGKVTMADEVETGHGVLFHTLPHCQAFEEKDPVTFIRDMPVQ